MRKHDNHLSSRRVTARTRAGHTTVTRLLYDPRMKNDQTKMMDDRESTLDENVGTPDELLREQLLPLKPLQCLQPEARLALAVLEDAAETLRTTYGVETLRAQRLASQAWTWLESNDTHHPFTFRVICQHLELDAEWLRRGLARWRPTIGPSTRRETMARRSRRAA